MSRHAHWEIRFWSRVMFLPGDMCWQWTGARSSLHGSAEYGKFILDGRTVRPHTVAYRLLVDPNPNLKLDHRCRNKLCVRPDHLRPATHKQNGENLGINSNNTSGYRGVHWCVRSQRWIAKAKHNGRDIYAGSFQDKEEAHEAVVAKRLELYTYNELDRRVA